MNFIKENELFLLEQVVKKNFSSKYKGSVLGILWSILKPLSMMIILTIVFSQLFTGRIENYPVYILTGRCLIDFFSSGVSVSMNALKNNKNILEKTAAPKHIFIIGSVLSELINFLISFSIVIVVMIVTKAPFYFFAYPFLIVPFICEILLIMGFSFALSVFRVFYTDIQYLWGIVTQILFYACAIFYPISIIPDFFRKYMILNPIFWFIDQARNIIMYGTIPEFMYMINLIIISMIVFVSGIIIFKKYEKKVTMKF